MTLLEAVGWALVHFVWQGALVAGLVALALASMRRASATLRYAVSVGALFTMAVLPAATAWRAMRAPAPPIVAAISQRAASMIDPASSTAGSTSAGGNHLASESRSRRDAPIGRATPDRSATGIAALAAEQNRLRESSATDSVGRTWLRAALPGLVGAWIVGVILLSLRLLGGWLRARRLSRIGVGPVPDSCREAAARLAARLNVRVVVRVLESHLIEAPIAIGWLRPVILLPTSAFTGLTIEHLDAIIAHELAHIRRHDYVVNLAQSVIETVLFYHPAVWWVSRQVRQEREHCCDDAAVAACGDRQRYARALVGMERLRCPVPLPVVRANGGSLVMRIRRLLTPEISHVEPTPRWAASVIALATALTVGVAAGVPAAVVTSAPIAVDPDAGAPVTATQTATATQKATQPPTIIQAADPAASLADKWTRAEQDARARGWTSYGIGYAVQPPAGMRQLLYSDRTATIIGDSFTLRGTFYGDFENLRFPGGVISSLLGGNGDPRRIKVVYFFATGNARTPGLTRLHASTFGLPVELDGQPVVWLGDASTAQSLPVVQRLYGSADAKTKEDLVRVLGVHDDSSLVVPALVGILNSDALTPIRAQATERLAWHPAPASLTALERAARSDRSTDVRREAAETIGELDMPGATPLLVSLTKTLDDREVRREAVEALGERPEPAAREALVNIVQTDRDMDVQREAVETLGELKDQAGLAAVQDIARSHANAEIRREAVESLAHLLAADQAIPQLARIAREDASVEVQREAVETLGEVKDPRAVAALIEIARTHPHAEVRREAIETIGDAMPGDEGIAFLARAAREDKDPDIQREAVETLGEIENGRGLAAVTEILKTHPGMDARREAIETLRDHLPPADAVTLLTRVAREDQSVEVQREAAESLGQVPDGAAVMALFDLARTHPQVDVRREAVETLGDAPVSKDVVDFLTRIAREDTSVEIQRQAIETLGEVDGGRGLAEVAQLALTHPNVDTRREAIETLGEHAPTPTALDVLTKIATNDRDEDARREALETLSELHDGAGIPALIDIARSHPSQEMRMEALKRLVDSEDPRAKAVFERALGKP
jgi:HEAT repeat protein/beta-lactamase regulating signal transducer with metallopeptidase domain